VSPLNPLISFSLAGAVAARGAVFGQRLGAKVGQDTQRKPHGAHGRDQLPGPFSVLKRGLVTFCNRK
jgi:hypothetical protein